MGVDCIKSIFHKKCTLVVLWIKSALRYIFNDRIYSGLDWKIDVKNIPKIIYEERILERSSGGTRKKEKYIKKSMIGKILEMDWKRYFIKQHQPTAVPKNYSHFSYEHP